MRNTRSYFFNNHVLHTFNGPWRKGDYFHERTWKPGSRDNRSVAEQNQFLDLWNWLSRRRISAKLHIIDNLQCTKGLWCLIENKYQIDNCCVSIALLDGLPIMGFHTHWAQPPQMKTVCFSTDKRPWYTIYHTDRFISKKYHT